MRFCNGSLPEQRQLFNVFLDKVLIYPEYIEVYIKNIPDHLHKSTKDDTLKFTGNISAFELGGTATVANQNENDNIEHIEDIKLFAEKSYFGTGSRTNIENEKAESCDEQDSAKNGGAEGQPVLTTKLSKDYIYSFRGDSSLLG